MDRRDFLALVSKASVSMAYVPVFVSASIQFPSDYGDAEWVQGYFDYGRYFGVAGRWPGEKRVGVRVALPREEWGAVSDDTIEAMKKAVLAIRQERRLN